MNETPRTDDEEKSTDKLDDQDWGQAGWRHARQLERELNEARKQRNEAKSEIERLKNAITEFYRDFDCISWGYDGNCGSGLLADDLFESLEKPTEGDS